MRHNGMIGANRPMPRTCNYDGCTGATKIIDDNGVTDPTKDRWELYQCEFGHEFSITLAGRP